MRQKFIFTVAVCLCAVLAFGVASAAERDRDYNTDRAKRTILGGPQEAENTDIVDIQATFDQYTASPAQNHQILIDAPGAQAATAAQNDMAYKLLVLAGRQNDSDAVSTLNRILRMDLASSPQADKILADAHQRLGQLYGHSNTKQLHHLSLAMQYAAGAQRRQIEAEIQTLGGDTFAMAFNQQQVHSVHGGGNDTCDLAMALGQPDISILADPVTPPGDHDWYSFDIVTGDPGVGSHVTIETIDNGGYYADTDLNLYSGCDAGTPTGFLEFDDDGGVGFMSFIDRSCMAEGTYYLEVGGFADFSQADNFNLDITVLSTGCFVRTPDAFEPDNDRATASLIGIPNPPGAPGAVQSEIQAEEVQAHNIYPAGDNDFVKFALNQASLMNIRTAKQIGTIFNGYVDIPLPGFGEDTVMELLYNEPKDYGGLCNNQVCPAPEVCGIIDGNYPCLVSNGGSECPDPPINPHPAFPPVYCLPWSLFGYGIATWPSDNAILFNDDCDLGGGDLGSCFDVCLPRTDVANPFSSVDTTPFNWYVNTGPFGSLDFDYEILVHNHAACRFESEPNNSLGLPVDSEASEASSSSKSCSGSKSKSGCGDDLLPNALVLGESIYGMNEFSIATVINSVDVDVFSFDVDGEVLLTFETHSPDTGADTTLEIYVGPDLLGDFFFTGLEDDDGGAGLMSRIKANFIPACELLGTCPASGGSEASKSKSKAGDTAVDSEFFIAVGTPTRAPDFPYELSTSIDAPALIDTEPNDVCPDEGQPITIGDTVLGSIGASCDYDTYSFSLLEATDVSFETITGGDTVIELSDAACDRIGCDDDGGPGLSSAISSCLPAGDYNLRVRAYSNIDLFNYNLESDGVTGCVPTDPPTTTGDGLFTCSTPDGFDDCVPVEPPDHIEGGVDWADCGGGGAQPGPTVALGDLVGGDLFPTCDYDAFYVSVAADTEVFIRGFGGDFALQLADTNCDEITCDDDTGSGGASPYEPLLAGCLAAGDYIVRARPFSSTVTFSYTIDFGDLGPCDSGVDPPVEGDEVFTCSDFDGGQGCSAP